MSAQFVVSTKVTADASQYTSELTRAGQTTATYTQQVQTGSTQVSSALQSTATAAQAMGSGLRVAGAQGAEGLNATTAAARGAQSAGTALLASLREQITVSGKSTDELLRYRAAQSGVAAEAAPLILQLQNQRAAQQLAAESARAEEAAQRANAAAKQQSVAAQESFLTGLRDQAALQGKSQTEVMRYRAAQLGVTEGAEQYIRALEQGNSVHRVGTLSAKEHANAMRMLPMQMTDVVTSLAGGMPIWMVAIQQGGQIKDSFHGVGNALRSILGAISPTVAGIALLTGVVGLGVTAYAQGSREADGYRHAIVMTGNAAGTTVGQMSDMARAISQVTGTRGAAAEGLAQMAGSGAVAASNLQRFTDVAMGLEKYAGVPVKNTVQELAQLAKAPLEASVKLNEQYHYLSASVYEHIKALDEQGRKEEATAAAQQAYIAAFQARKDQLVANLGAMERAWNSIAGAAKRGWDAILNIGREETTQQKLDALGERIAALRKMQESGGFADTGGGAALGRGNAGAQARERELQALLAQQATLQETARLDKRGAEAAADRAKQSEAKANWDKEGEQFKTRQAKRDDEIRKAEIEGRALIAQRLLTEEGLRTRIADIREKYKDPKAAGGIAVTDNELATLQGQLQAAKLYHEQLVTLGAGASELNAGERESLKIGEQLARVTDAKTTARLREKQAISDALGVQLRSNDGLEKSLKAHQASIDAAFKDADAITQRAAAQEAANATLGKSKTAIEQLTLAELQKQMAEAQATDSFDPKYIAGLELKIAAQQRYVTALGQADYKAAEQHANELLRNAQELGRAYEDEQQLSGLTALEREKITAQRQVELRYAKELAAIDAKALSDAEKQALRDKTLEAKRIETAAAVGKAEQQAQARASEEINRGLTDALMRGFESGKGFAQNLADTTVNLFKTMVLRPTISAIMQPVSLVINGIVQQGLNALGLGSGAAQAVSTAGNAMSLLSLGKNIYQAITGGFASLSGTVATSVQSGLNWLSGSGGMIGQGPIQVGGFASGMGTIAGYGAGMLGGLYGGRLISGGYSAFGSSGNAAVNVGTIAGSLFGPLGSLVGGLLGGVVNRLFGRKLKDAGIEGDFGGETGFEGRTFKYYKGGLFRSDKTEYSALEEETRKAFADTFTAMKDGTKGMAEVLGLGTEAIDGFTAHIKVSLNGLSAEEADKRLKEEFDKIAETLASTTLGTEEYTREGETAVETLTRLSSSLTGVNAVFENLGYTLYQSSLAGADMASQLVDLFGSLEGFSQATGVYFQNFYSPEEQRAAQRRALEKQFDSMGLAMPDIDAADAREQFKALAEAQDQTTEAGRKNWAMLMQLSGAFASVTQSGEDAAAASAAAAKAEADARKAATDAAWSAMQKSIAAAREAAQAEIDLRQQRLATAQAIVDLTRSQARELRGLVTSTVAITAAQANAAIDAAVAAARSGQLPEQQGLSEAISAARAGMGTSAYTNRLDYEAAQLILANKLDAIGDSGQAQVDVNQLLLEQAKNEVDRLDMLIKAGQAALDEARGNTVAVRDVETAVKVFYERLFKEQDSNADTGSGTGSSGSSPFVSGPGGGSGGGISPGDHAELKAQNIRDYISGVYSGSSDYADAHALSNISAMAYLSNWSLSDMASALKVPAEDIVTLMEGAGFTHWRSQLPAFAAGGSHRGGLRLVGEDGPELEVTGPSRIYNSSQTQQLLAGLQGGSNAEVVAAIRELQRQGYDIGRTLIVLMQSMENLARKQDAIGVLQRETVPA